MKAPFLPRVHRSDLAGCGIIGRLGEAPKSSQERETRRRRKDLLGSLDSPFARRFGVGWGREEDGGGGRWQTRFLPFFGLRISSRQWWVGVGTYTTHFSFWQGEILGVSLPLVSLFPLRVPSTQPRAEGGRDCLFSRWGRRGERGCCCGGVWHT